MKPELELKLESELTNTLSVRALSTVCILMDDSGVNIALACNEFEALQSAIDLKVLQNVGRNKVLKPYTIEYTL